MQLQGRRVDDRPGPRCARLLAPADRRQRDGAAGGARRGQPARPDLARPERKEAGPAGRPLEVTVGSDSAGREVLAALLCDPALFLEVAENPVEVVRLDFHLLGHVRSADSGRFLDQAHGLVGAGAATSFAAAARGRGPGGRAGFASTRTTRCAPDHFAAKLGKGALEALTLLVKVREALLNQLPGLVEYVRRVGHRFPFHPKVISAVRSVAQ